MTRNTRINVTALLAAAGATGIALGDFSGMTGLETLRYYAADGSTITDFDNAAYGVQDLYANFHLTNTHGFDNEDSHLLNLFNVNVVDVNGTGLFFHNDITGSGNRGDGSWKPSFSFDIPGTANSTIDSFVTIGGGVGALAATNVTTPDPNLGAATSADIFNEDVGWFINPPHSTQGDAIELRVWVGRFVVTGDQARAGACYRMSGLVGYNYGVGTGAFFGDFQTDIFCIPTPATVALMGIGGTLLRRRRR